jgi:CRP/FNR family transcriptional regulator, cyclic AMP receptor protein
MEIVKMQTTRERPIDFRIFKAIDLPPRNVAAGEILISAGSTEAVMYVISSGKFAIKIGEKSIEEVGAGQVVGEMSLIDSSERSADVVALVASVVVPIDEPRFLNIIVKTPHFALLLMRLMVRRIRTMNAKV